MFCPNCGKQISDNSKFCGFCGAVMTPPAVPITEQPAAAVTEPMPVVEQPVAAVTEPVPVVEQQPVAAVTEPMPVVESQPVAAPMEPMPVVEPQPVAAVTEPMPVVESQPVAAVTEPMPVVEPQPVTAPMESMPVVEQQPMAAPISQPVVPMQQAAYQQPAAAPMQPMQGGMPPFSPVPPEEKKKKKKGKAGLIVAIVVLLLALAGGGVFAFMYMNRPAKKIMDAFAANDIDAVVELYEKVGDKDREGVTSQARDYAEKLTEGYLDGTGEQDYKTVKDVLDKLSDSVLEDDDELEDWMDTIDIVNASRSSFKQAESYKEAGSYVEALAEYAKVVKMDELNFARAQQAMEETKNLYREAAMEEAKSYEDAGNYEEARDVYEEALTVLEGDTQLLNAIDALEAAVVEQAFISAMEAADEAVSEGRYSDAKSIINAAMEIEGISSGQQQALSDKLSEITDAMYADGSILGAWKMDCDLSSSIASELGAEFEDFEGTFIVTIIFEFQEDGTFRMYLDEESFRENFDGWLDEVILYTVDTMYDMFAEMGLSKEETDELLQDMYNMTMEEYLRESMETEMDPQGMADSILEDVDMTGVYRVDGDRLYMAEQEIDESRYDNFHFEEDKLIIELPDGVDSEELLPGISYPFELTRVQ